LQDLKSVPSEQWMKMLETIRKEDVSKAVEKPFEDVQGAIRQELEVLRMWTSARVAMALAQFEVERGSFPTFLPELAPQYLETIPLCPEGGEPFKYKPGELWCDHSGSRWKVTPRK